MSGPFINEVYSLARFVKNLGCSHHQRILKIESMQIANGERIFNHANVFKVAIAMEWDSKVAVWVK